MFKVRSTCRCIKRIFVKPTTDEPFPVVVTYQSCDPSGFAVLRNVKFAEVTSVSARTTTAAVVGGFISFCFVSDVPPAQFVEGKRCTG